MWVDGQGFEHLCPRGGAGIHWVACAWLRNDTIVARGMNDMETTDACDTVESRVVTCPYGPPRYSLGVKVVMVFMRQVVGWICFVRDGQPTPLGAGYSGVVSPPVRFRPCPGPRSAQHSPTICSFIS